MQTGSRQKSLNISWRRGCRWFDQRQHHVFVMLLTIQFPIADVRSLAHHSGVLNTPNWMYPTPEFEFARNFGMIRFRKKGGLEGWIGENEICEADNAIRFHGDISIYKNPSNRKTHIRCAFRRFYFDGQVVGKYEVGLGIRHRREIELTGIDGGEFIDHILSLPVTIHVNKKETTCELIRAGKSIASAYRQASTQHGYEPSPEWTVHEGVPILFLEHENEKLSFPFQLNSVYQDEHYQLFWGLIPHKGQHYRIWLLHTDAQYSAQDAQYDKARLLRIALLRLNAEREGLRIVLRQIDNKKITNIDDNIQEYLKSSTSKIIKIENSTKKNYSDNVVKIARNAIHAITPGERARMLKSITGIRKNVYENTAAVTDKEEEVHKPPEPATNITIEKMIFADQYIGTVRESGTVNITNVHERLEKEIKKVDLEKLSEELEKLDAAIKKIAKKPEQKKCGTTISAARKNAQNGDRKKLTKNLAVAGKWTLDVAKQIGVPLVAELLKISLFAPK